MLFRREREGALSKDRQDRRREIRREQAMKGVKTEGMGSNEREERGVKGKRGDKESEWRSRSDRMEGNKVRRENGK